MRARQFPALAALLFALAPLGGAVAAEVQPAGEPAEAELVQDQLRAALLRGEYEQALALPALAEETAPPEAVARDGFHRGLAAFALKDYAGAVSTLVTVAEKFGAEPIGVKAAVVVTMALARNGDRENTCQYASVVGPLTASLPAQWGVWVEQARVRAGCE